MKEDKHSDERPDPKNSKPSSKKKEINPEHELEKAEMLRKADESAGQQLTINTMGELKSEDEIKHFALGNIPDDPDKKYDVYYKGIERLLKEFLPTEKKYADVRKWIREEKNIFLTRGHKLENGKRGADSRMALISDMEEMMNIIATWATTNRSLFELYYLIKAKNDDLGYHNS